MELTAIKPSSSERCIDCANYVEGDICHICEFIPKKKTTNADRIRAMTDEELAKLIVDDWCELINCESVLFCNGIGVCNGDCEERVLNWLKEEVEDDNTNKESES